MDCPDGDHVRDQYGFTWFTHLSASGARRKLRRRRGVRQGAFLCLSSFFTFAMLMLVTANNLV
jgi:hypothetical protein